MAHGSPGVPRPSRKKSHRHPLLQGRKSEVWHEDLVGVVPGYPKSPEAFETLRTRARERMIRLHKEGGFVDRTGIPDGWSGRKAERAAIMARADKEAADIVAVLVEKGVLDAGNASNEALQTAVAFVRAGDAVTVRDRLAAARLVLDFTRAKPESSSRVRLEKAEDFLAKLAEEAAVKQ